MGRCKASFSKTVGFNRYMRVVLILIISFLTLVGCGSNTNDEMNNNVELGALSVEGCIQMIGKTMFLMDHDGVMMKISVNKIDMNELTEGKSYKLELSQILESNPPIIIVESYKEINKNYCD